jgi:hypothetical protein
MHRYYDPVVGQFISVDPMVAETAQPYTFDGNDPENTSDPDGDWIVYWPTSHYLTAGQAEWDVFWAIYIATGCEPESQLMFDSLGYGNRYVDVWDLWNSWANEVKTGYNSLTTGTGGVSNQNQLEKDGALIRNGGAYAPRFGDFTGVNGVTWWIWPSAISRTWGASVPFLEEANTYHVNVLIFVPDGSTPADDEIVSDWDNVLAALTDGPDVVLWGYEAIVDAFHGCPDLPLESLP